MNEPVAFDPDISNNTSEEIFELDDIKIIHHPAANRANDTYSFHYYIGAPEYSEGDAITTAAANATDPDSDINTQNRPWRPFPTRLDFELAEVMLDGHLNSHQIERVISIVHQVTPTPDNSGRFTLKNASDLSHIWDYALQTRASGVIKCFNNIIS